MKRILVMGSSRPYEQMLRRAAHMVGVMLARSGFGLVSGNATGVDKTVAQAFCLEIVRLNRNPSDWFCQLRLPFLIRGSMWPLPGYRAPVDAKVRLKSTFEWECVTGCNTVEPMNDVTQVSYTSDEGTILPELQWHEKIVITKNKVSLARNGRTADTQINAGSWEIPVDAQKIAALFEQLARVDCATIKRVEPDDVPDGGGTESYTIAYVRGRECSLMYDPGTTYTNGDLLVEPINLFIHGLALPPDAASRYQLPDS